jgi:hypothetical protein
MIRLLFFDDLDRLRQLPLSIPFPQNEGKNVTIATPTMHSPLSPFAATIFSSPILRFLSHLPPSPHPNYRPSHLCLQPRRTTPTSSNPSGGFRGGAESRSGGLWGDAEEREARRRSSRCSSSSTPASSAASMPHRRGVKLASKFAAEVPVHQIHGRGQRNGRCVEASSSPRLRGTAVPWRMLRGARGDGSWARQRRIWVPPLLRPRCRRRGPRGGFETAAAQGARRRSSVGPAARPGGRGNQLPCRLGMGMKGIAGVWPF